MVQVGFMPKCPDCLRESNKIKKQWKFSHYDVEAYSCECGTDFRSYKMDGNEKFKLKKGKNDNRYCKPKSTS